MEVVQRITKPNLVDMLRMCDRKRWCCPRIRYASIRSKPDLCKDLLLHFIFTQAGHFITVTPIKRLVKFPDLQYHVKERRFYLDGTIFDCAKVSRARPQFHLERKPVTLEFGTLYATRLCSGKVAAFVPMFP